MNNADGLYKLGKALDIDIVNDVFITYFIFKCGCTKYGKISKDEYSTGLNAFGAKTIDDVKKKLYCKQG